MSIILFSYHSLPYLASKQISMVLNRQATSWIHHVQCAVCRLEQLGVVCKTAAGEQDGTTMRAW